jgi:hypothetical protein
LRAFDGFKRQVDRAESFGGLDRFQSQALEIITSPAVRDPFELSGEPPRVLERFGKGKCSHQTVKDILYDWDVKSWVRARRLIEAGVRVVTLRVAAWDHHSGPQSDFFAALRMLLPLLDQSLCAQLEELRERGLDRDVLVVVLGEFGRHAQNLCIGPRPRTLGRRRLRGLHWRRHSGRAGHWRH